MNLFRMTWIVILYMVCTSCENDRERVKAGDIRLEGSWKYVMMEYINSNGQPVTYIPQNSSNPPTNMVTLIEADRTGVLKIDGSINIFKYTYAQGTCTFTFDDVKGLAVEPVDVPFEPTGKVFQYKYTFKDSKPNVIVLQSDKEFLKSSKEIIKNVRYTYSKL